MGPSLGEVTFYMMYTASCLPVYLYVEVPVGKCINAGSMVAGMVRIGMRQERGKTESERWKQRKRLQVTRNRMTWWWRWKIFFQYVSISNLILFC